MKRFLSLLLILASVFSAFSKANTSIKHAYKNRQSDVQVQGKGKVIKVLPDDNIGSRHQKFIVRLNAQQTVLIAHNIDLAPRVKNIQKGDTIHFYGEYEWSEKGGVIHWTHKDPQNQHPHGWLKHNNTIYQ